MKKSLLAVAAIGAFASAAQAQSSVTVYGILDVGFGGQTARFPQTTTTSGAVTTNAYKTNATSMGSSGESNSRLGFKGVEDLGGGLSGFFTLEMGVAPTNSNGFTNMTNRQSFVGVKKNGLGSAAIGTQYTPVHTAVAVTDPGQINNQHGNLIYAVSTTTVNSGQSTAYTVRANNALTVTTDKFAGFGLNAIYSNNNTNQTQYAAANSTTATTAGGNTNNQVWGIGADYTFKKFYATAAYQVLKQEADMVTTASLTAVTSTVGAGASGPNSNQPTTNGTSAQTYAAATYDFGILKAYAQWINNKATSNLNSNQFAKRTAQQIGVRSFITPNIEAWGSIANGRITAFGEGSPTANMTGYQLGTNYLLSKRTNLYAIYGSSQTSTVNSATVQGAAGNSSYSVGVRHTF